MWQQFAMRISLTWRKFDMSKNNLYISFINFVNKMQIKVLTFFQVIGVGNSSSFAGYPPINPISGRAGHSSFKIIFIHCGYFFKSCTSSFFNLFLSGSSFLTFFLLNSRCFCIFLAGSSCFFTVLFLGLSLRQILSFCFSLFFAITITIIL